MRLRKDTRVELVAELRALSNSLAPRDPARAGLGDMIVEAEAGEYHDFKNRKYVCGKVEASSRLRRLGFPELATRIEAGEFDEQPDTTDVLAMRSGFIGTK